MVSPVTAQQLGVTTGDYVTLRLGGRYMGAGVFIVPGHADNSVTLHLGYGRSRAGHLGTGPGFDAYLLRTSTAPEFALGLQVEKTGKKYYFASTQQQYAIEVDGQLEEEESIAALGDERDSRAHRHFRRVQQEPQLRAAARGKSRDVPVHV